MNIALMAHDRKKELMVQFCIAYCGILAEHSLCATHVTGKLVSEATGLPITLYLHADQGGAQQIGARISFNEIDLVLFFCDPAISDTLCHQCRHGRGAGAGTAPGRSGLAQHRQSPKTLNAKKQPGPLPRENPAGAAMLRQCFALSAAFFGPAIDKRDILVYL